MSSSIVVSTSTLALIVSCLACAGHARRVRPTSRQKQPGSEHQLSYLVVVATSTEYDALADSKHSEIHRQAEVTSKLCELAMSLLQPKIAAGWQITGLGRNIAGRSPVQSHTISRSAILMQENDGFEVGKGHTKSSSLTTDEGDGNVGDGDDGDHGGGSEDGGALGSKAGNDEELRPAVIDQNITSDNSEREENGTTRDGGQKLKDSLKEQNDANVQNMFKVIESKGWQHVVTVDGENPITVWKKTILPGTYIASDAANDEAAAKFDCVKSTAIIAAPPREVYKLFLDNLRVNEYNEHCAQLEDIEHLSRDTKIAWSATPPVGIFKARDFLTMVHFRKLPDGTLIVVNRPALHPARPAGGRYQRAEILLAGNVIKPVKGDPDKTELTMIAHVNPGGIVDNAFGAAILNKLTSKSPIEYINKLEVAARKTMIPAAGPYPKINFASAKEAVIDRLKQRRSAAESMVQSLQQRCKEAASTLYPPGPGGP